MPDREIVIDPAPEPPAFAEALAATASFPGLRFHPYPRCVACGTGWLEGKSGRTLTAGSAIYSREGIRQGFSRQTWITVAGPGTRP
jgi:hypothetical protein